MNLRTLFSFQGRVQRATYAVVGILGVLLKHSLDRLLAYSRFNQPWGLFNYLSPLGRFAANHALSTDEKKFLLALAATALPFIWVGIAMTLKRLRDAGQPIQLVFLFFVPAINVLFFLLLCLIPTAEPPQVPPGNRVPWVARLLPKSKLGTTLFSSVVCAAIAVAFAWYAVAIFGNYGWTLFMAVPFFMGFLSTWLYSYRHECTYTECFFLALGSVFLAAVFIAGFALEGIICLALCAPLAVPLAALGAYVAYVMRATRNLEARSNTVLSLLFAIPLMVGAEFLAPGPTPEFQTHTAIEISAPPELVWQRIIAFPRIDAPLNPLFRAGISYPLEARIVGTGLTADRKCIFSSGAFNEPILAWEEGKHFAFGVSEEPPLMKELSPYGAIHVRHLDDHDFRPLRADFYLTELPGGRTRLDGVTTYQNRMWPGAYWRLWTDAIVHQIHFRVFNQVKKLAEQDASIRQEAPKVRGFQ